MAYTITVTDVNNTADLNTSDENIRCIIDLIDLADECLDLNQVPLEAQKLAKIYAVLHMIQMQQGGGVRSESDMDGESVTFARSFSKQGLGGSPFGQLLSNMQGYSCIARVIDRPRRSFNTVNAEDVRIERSVLVPRRFR